MNEEILSRFRKINNVDALKTFFSLLNHFITELGLSSDNEKLSLNIREDKYKRFSVNLNGRLVFALNGNEDDLEYRFMVDEEDIAKIASSIKLKQRDEFKDIGKRAYQIDIPWEHIIEKNIDLLISFWIKSCKNYEPTQDKSQFRVHHTPELYELAFNNKLLEEYLSKLNQVTWDKTIWKLGCNWGENAPDFYDLIKRDKIVITHEDYLFAKGDLVLITRGYWANAIARVLGKPQEVTINNELESSFKDYSIPFDNHIFYCTAEWYELPPHMQFEYKLRKGIRKIQDINTRRRVADLWNSRSKNIDDKQYINMHNNKTLLLNQIMFGPPGTGKTYHTIDMAVKIADPTAYVEGDHEHNKEIFDKLIETGQIVFTTFHQSISYEDFVEGIKPKSVQGSVFYSIEEGVFKQLCKKAKETYSYLITIDNKEVPLTKELLSELYYEASSLLPPHSENHSDFKLKTPEDYEFELFRNQSNSIVVKAGTKQNNITLSLNEITRVLFENKIPFYKSYTNRVIEGFIMKDKVFKRNEVDNSRIPFILIIDEINRGNVSQIFGELITLIEEDKRIGKREAIEVTLPYSKDKFGVPPNLYIIGTMNTADRSVESLDTALRRRFSFIEMPPNYKLNELNREIEGFSLSELLLTINNRLERLLDKDRLIGHSYFMKVNTLDDLRMVFQNNIIPLLQEYFFGDFGKIGLVLGGAFLEENTNNTRFASFPAYDNDYAERRIYRLKNFTAINNEEMEISDNMFKDALTALLNK